MSCRQQQQQQQQDERVHEIASSIELQLNALFPDGFSLDEQEKSSQLEECFQNLVKGPPPHPDDLASISVLYRQDELKQAIPIAVRQWKKQQAARKDTKTSAGGTNTAKSFSLLDQFNSGGFGLPIFNLEEILQIPSVPERLEKLEKIEYLEDALPDWRDIREMILSGIRHYLVVSQKDNENVVDSSKDPVEAVTSGSDQERCIVVTKGYLKLHRKWFHEARSSSEYLGVQYDLCSNLSKCIAELMASSSSPSSDSSDDNQWMFDLIRNWHDMFFDMMQRDQYSSDAAKDIESTFLQCLKSQNSGIAVQDGTITPAHMIALVDPQAKCFATWIHHLSPLDLVARLEQTELLPVLWGRCQATGSEKLTSILRWQSLSILTFVLMKTRVAMFPWHLLRGTKDNNGMDLDDQQQQGPSSIIVTKEQVLNLFLESMLVQQSGQHGWRRHVCCNAIGTILSGSTSDASTDRSQLLSNKVKATLLKLRSDLGDDSLAVRHLEDVLSEVER